MNIEPHLLLYQKIEGKPAHTGVEMVSLILLSFSVLTAKNMMFLFTLCSYIPITHNS